MSRREALRTPLETAQAWYDGASKSVLEGLLPIDQALLPFVAVGQGPGGRLVEFDLAAR
jgi:hypothetical protein